MSKFEPSFGLIGEAMRSDVVRAALREKAYQLANEVDELGDSEGVEMGVSVSTGTRPKGRPFGRVESENVEQEWGSRNSERRRILGRVAERHRGKR